MRDRSLISLTLLCLLVLGTACGGMAGIDDAPSSAAAGVQERMFDEAFVKQIYEEAVAALEQGAGIRLPEPVPALLLTVEQARERRTAFARALEEDSGVTSAMDLLADVFFSGSMLGRYLPDEKVLYIINEGLVRGSRGNRERAEELLFGVMAHELVHAYDDQVYHVMPDVSAIMEIAANGSQLPELQARMSLIEGRATYAAELACAQAGKRLLPAFTIEDAQNYKVRRSADSDDILTSVGVGVFNVIARLKLVQYAYGREFAKAAFDFGGEKFFEQIFAHLPLSLAELEDFNLFKRRWAAEVEAAMDAAEEAELSEAVEP